MTSRRDFIKLCGLSGGVFLAPAWTRKLLAAPARYGLSDAALQPKFVHLAPNALSPAFKFLPTGAGQYSVAIRQGRQRTGLADPKSGRLLSTPIWGYSDERGPTWPGRTFEVKSARAAGGPP